MVKQNVFTRVIQGLRRAAGDPVDRLCDIIAAVGVGALGIAITGGLSVFAFGIADIPVLTFFIPAVWYLIGYVLQSIVLAAIGKKRAADYSWEGTAKYFVFRQALPVLFVCVVGILLTRPLWFEYYRGLMLKGRLSSFDDYSLQPFVSVAASFGMLGLGIRSAFFPGNQLMSIRRVLTSTGVCAAVFALLLASNAGTPGTLMGVFVPLFSLCFIVYIACSAIIMNQSVIMRKSLATTVAKIGTNARIYDMKMVLLWILGAVAVGAAVFLIVSGLWYIFKFIFFLGLWTVLNSDKSNYHEKLDTAEISTAVFEGNDFAGPAAVIGTIVTIVAVVLMVIFARTGAVQALFSAIKQWIESIIGLIMGKDTYVPETEINYRDEVGTLTVPESARRTQLCTRSGKPTLRDFRGRLEKLPEDERLTYSYVVMIDLLRELNPALTPNLTPDELSRKIKSTTSVESIDEITKAVELVSYAERSPADAGKALGAMVSVIEKRLS